MRYVPGKQHLNSNCLSRAPLSDNEPVSLPEDIIGVNLVVKLGLKDTSLKRFKGSSIVDETSREVMQYSHERVAGLERRS